MLFSTSAVWHHVKKYSTTQNGCHVWRTLQDFFFGGDKVSTMHSDIMLTLKNLYYSGDRKNHTQQVLYCPYGAAQLAEHSP
jgi:hypothetical protein